MAATHVPPSIFPVRKPMADIAKQATASQNLVLVRFIEYRIQEFLPFESLARIYFPARRDITVPNYLGPRDLVSLYLALH